MGKIDGEDFALIFNVIVPINHFLLDNCVGIHKQQDVFVSLQLQHVERFLHIREH